MSSHFWFATQWYLTLLLFGAVALPLTFAFFRFLPERGYALTKAVGVLSVGYAFWFLGAIGLLRNDTTSIWLMLLLVGGIGWLWLGRAQALELWEWLKRNWRLVLAIEIFTALAFALLVWFRAHNPEILGTEKPMEYMFLNAILRSPTFPPHDAWLAGHAISYYYFGYVLIAMLTQLTGIDSAIAFNLGLATVFALTAANSWSVVYNLILWAQQHLPRPTPPQPQIAAETAENPADAEAIADDLQDSDSKTKAFVNPLPASPARGGGVSQPPVQQPASLSTLNSPLLTQLPLTPFFAALLAPLFVLIIGNFYGLAHMAYVNGSLSDFNLWAIRYDFTDPITNETKPGVRADMVNLWAWLDLKQMPPPGPPPAETFNWNTGYNWFFGARVVHDKNLVGQETEAIDEMPAFSFILGDMHPHVLGLPFVVLATALALEWLLWAAHGGLAAFLQFPLNADALRAQGANYLPLLYRLVFSAQVLGALVFLNTWDFPIYWFVTALALGAGCVWYSGWLTRAGWVRLAALVVGLAVVSVLAYFPFFLTFQSQAGGFLPNLVYPTRFQQTVVFFGPVLFGVLGVATWLALKYRAQFSTELALWVGGGILGAVIVVALTFTLGAALNPEINAMVDRFLEPLDRATATGLVVQRRLVDSWATLIPAILIGLCAGVGLGLLRAAKPPAQNSDASPTSPHALPIIFALILLLTGALLALGPEWLYLRDNFGTRMNTIFKFYFQTWTLWALVTAFGAWCIARWARPVASAVFLIGLTLCAFGGLLYTIPSAWSKAGGFSGTPHLDGMQVFADQHPEDWAVIQWLRASAITGLPVIAEAPGGAYAIEDSRIAMATGFPGVIGWTNHEGQWRGNYYGQVAERPGQLEALYRAIDSATIQAVLAQYDIEYVYIGGTERAKYRPDGGVFYNAMELVLWVDCGVDSNFQPQCTVHPGSELAQHPDKLSILQLASALLFRRHATVAP